MDLNEKYQNLGHWAKCILDLHKEKPGLFNDKAIVEALLKRYEQLQFEAIKEEV
ncbi:hypothetical protein J14TS2_16530 [Bacillus sp. J14TS2]|uniref:hypothetical protein n=1 Tax=Bacillus sp. J14TS2 TaxID=2807188 RepID=UPI001B1E3EB3|nr:hypothetical protein [Bacillus sp. J14TS2]GIN71178.1 hypothetical protein J14TS2_16530 [Bacillus sp. J14TS2]